MPPSSNDLQFMLGEINAKLDELISRAKEDRDALAKLTDRVSKLEAFQWKTYGIAAALAFATGIASRALWH